MKTRRYYNGKHWTELCEINGVIIERPIDPIVPTNNNKEDFYHRNYIREYFDDAIQIYDKKARIVNLNKPQIVSKKA
tara:strand:- start:141 stop:371 length:231 start_codon:yes stop_codon:yes gene_type:complete